MASDAAFFEVLENDLRALSAEARKTDSLATQITGWLQHTDFPQIKESAERAVLKLRAVAHEGRGVEAVRTQEILRPFLLVCESKNPRLIGIVLGSIQKLLAHNAVSDEGRTQIIQALQQVEKSSDDTVKLKILQTALTLLQNPRNVDDKDGAGQVLSICFRLYSQNRGSPKVVSTAAATIRQAVALLFDHTVLEQPLSPGCLPVPEGLASGREMAAMLLLQDLMNMCAGHTPTWLKCPMVGRAFVLDLLEFVLLHRPAAFQTHSSFKVLLQSKLAPCIAGLSQTALDPDCEPAATGEAKLLLRCLGALLRKHALLLPDMSLTVIELLLAGCSTTRMPWQRLLSLQVLRSLMADHQLLYVLFTSYDMSIHHDMNAVHDTLSVAVEAIKGYMKAAESSEDDMVAALSSIYSNRAVGKELQLDVDAHGPAQAGMQEVWTAYLAIEVLLAVVASVEVLTDAVSTSSAAAPSDPLLLAPLATAGSGSMHSALSSSNSLAGLVRGSSTQGTGTPCVSSVNTMFAMNNRGTPSSSPRGSTVSLSALAGEDSSRGPAAGSSSPLPAQPALSTLGSTTNKPRPQSAALSAPVVAAQHPGVAPLSAATVSTVVDVLWRPVLAGLSCALGHCRSRSVHESLMLVLLRAFQSYIFSAGALGEVPARDDFLKVLCEAAVTPAGAEDGAGSGSGESQAALRMSNPSTAPLDVDMTLSAAAPGMGSGTGLNAPGAALGNTQASLTLPGIGLKNVHCLRTVFNVAHRLADSLGTSWGLVVEVLYTLDKALPAIGSVSGGKMDEASFEPGTLTGELLILATAANQLFQSTQYMAPDAQASLMSALSQVSSRALAAAQAQGSAFMSSVAVSAGGQAPTGTLGSSTAAGQVKLPALNRMVEVLLYNLPRIQNLWPIFLTHLMEVLHSGNSVIRAAGLEALDRCLTGAIAAPDLGQPAARPPQQPALSSFPSFSQQQQQQTDAGGGSGSGQSTEGHAADVEHMLLVALEGMYKEEREPDVRLGLLRVALHVLQRHGEALSRGWVPLLRLLEAVPSWEDGTTISASYQCVESVCSDFLPTMPKVYIPKALEVVQLFAAQKSAINISLSAVGLLWNATDLLGRSRAAAIAAAAAAASAAAAAEPPAQPSQQTGSGVSGALGGIFSVLSLSRRQTVEEAAPKGAPGGSPGRQGSAATDVPPAAGGSDSITSSGSVRGGSPVGGKSSGGAGADADDGAESASAAAADAHLAGRSDLTEDECTELLIRVFEHLRAIGMDPRPEVRNSGMRTLFLAVGSQAGRFKAVTWRHCLWEILFPLVQYAHFMGDMSSSEEAAAVELGKEKGKAVMMLVHHSRNTEQKQWDETTVLAFNGLGKVMRAHMLTVLALPGINDKWDEVCKIASQALMSGRKSVAVAAAQLLTGFLQGFKLPAVAQTPGAPGSTSPRPAAAVPAAMGAASASAAANYTWKRTFTAIDEGVTVMAMPNTRVPLQARNELLGGLSAAYTAQASEGVFDVADMQLLLRWLDMLARNPKGTDDVKAVTGVLPPVQKLVLQLLGQINMALLPDAWPDMLRTLAGFLCPFRAMMQQRQQEAMAAAAAAPAGGSSADVAPLRTPRSGQVPGTPQAAGGLGPARSFNRLFSARPGGPVPAAATDAAQLTTQWMGKIIKRLVELYAHAPWQVRATLFGPVVHGLSECAALRYITPEDPLWQQAATGLTSIIQAGLPAVNIMFVNYSQQPENAWQVLADAFETFLLGEGLPEGLVPTQQQQQQHKAGDVTEPQQRQLQHSSSDVGSVIARQQQQQLGHSSSMGAGRAGVDSAAEAALQKAVLDTLTEQVLTSCSSAAHEQRSRLVRVLVVGAGSTLGHSCLQNSAMRAAAAAMGDATGSSSSNSAGTDLDTHAAAAAARAIDGVLDESGLGSGAQGVSGCAGPDQRFSQMCLRRLALLASRGMDGQAGSLNAVLLEVAQIALPQLMQRCRAVLQAYAHVEQAAVALELQQLQQQVLQQQQQQQALAGSLQQDGEGGGRVGRAASQAECTVVTVVQQWQQQVGDGQVMQQQCLVEEVLCVLHVLLTLQIDVAVFEQLLEQDPSLAACLAAVQHAQQVHAQVQQQQQQPQVGLMQQQQLVQQQQQQQPGQKQQAVLAADQARRNSSQGGMSEQGDVDNSRRHQGHLLLLYKQLADCAGCRDRRVGVLVRAALQGAGQQLGL